MWRKLVQQERPPANGAVLQNRSSTPLRRRRRLRGAAALATALLAGAPLWAQTASPGEDLDALSRDPAQWIMPAKNYASTRYSELDQINAGNVDKLQLAWTFSLGVNRGQEAAPIVVNGTMYVVGPFPNTLFALDATDGTLKWSYTPPTEFASQGVACCDVVNRGAAYADGKIVYNTLDNHTVAVDAETGEEVWHTKLGEISRGETMTMAPLVVKDKVLVGVSGGEMGVRGWITALDLETGEIVWQANHTGPDEDVLIGDRFKAPYPWMEGEDLGVKTWPADRWEIGGGTVWGWISYDPELDLIYYGSGNPGPWNPNQREGDNLWTTTIFARDPDTGEAVWAYQTSPHDLWDHDSVNELVLLDLEIDGEMRKVMIRPGRTGYMYVIDRTNGKVMSAEQFDRVTAYLGVDLETGRIIPNPEKEPRLGRIVEDVCPAPPGAKDWQPTAWSPKTKLLYVPHQHLCATVKMSEVGYIAGTPYLGASVNMYAATATTGAASSWPGIRSSRRRSGRSRSCSRSGRGTVATAGDVAFYGTMDRWMKAVDARTGEVLWKMRTPSGMIGQPTTYHGRGRAAVRGDPVGRGRLVRRGGAAGAGRAGAERRAGLLRRHAGPAGLHPAGQHPDGLRAAAGRGGGGVRAAAAIRAGLAATGAFGALAATWAGAALAATPAAAEDLKVCADPNNMPFSNRAEEGFENRLAEMMAGELGYDGVAYTWWAQRRGFLRNTLNAGECDAVMGVPMMDMLATTRPYYRSGYVFVTREDRGLGVSSIDAPELEDLTIGVHLIGDDGANTPPAHALGERGLADRVRGYPIYGDYREELPPGKIIDDVVSGRIDVAAVWGPLAGWHALRSETPLHVEPITGTSGYLPLVFQFSIGMGTRKEDLALRDRLDEAIVARRDDIDRLLASYGVPRL